MCGIAGIVSDRIQHLRPQLAQMRAALAHRGPDGNGEHIEPGCGLVHTRLSIIDLESGKQPMISNDGRYIVTFNGEIYGYKKLRAQLDYDFKTHSDTEVILALYSRYGKDMLPHLNGMFAFAIWDNVEKTLFCARDRFGEKPFFYTKTPDGDLLFGSELKALLATQLFKPDIDQDSLTHFLKKLYVHPSKSIYKNVFPLKPGHYLQYANGAITGGSYWEFPRTGEEIGLQDAREKLLDLMGNAISDQLIADVPIGAFLSGGLDSSTVVSVAAGKIPQLTTLSYRMKGNLDEGDYARAVAERYNTRHIELHEEQHSLPGLLQEMARVYDEPFADSSSIPTYLICQQARQHCKVVLTGDGADELFGGYVTKYRSLIHMLGTRNRPHLINAVDFLLTRLLLNLRRTPVGEQRATGLWLTLSSQSLLDAQDRTYQFFEDADLGDFGLRYTLPPSLFKPENQLNDAFKGDLENYMPGDILVKTDRASMANGIELRAPFLDRDLAEFAIGLPSTLKIDLQKDKKLLRETFEHQWPPKVQSRGKQGFGAPVEQWLRTPEVEKLTDDYLAPDRKIASLLDASLVKKHRDGKSYKAWTLLMLSLWLEQQCA